MRGGSLEGHWEKIARTFSRSWGIRVVLSGTACHFDGTGTIKIPANADHLKEADQRILEGMLDHEWGHAAEEVEAKEKGHPSIFTVLGRQKSNAMQILVNAFEDIRIETKNGAKYVGVAENLRRMNEFLSKHMGEEARAGRISNWQMLYCGIMSRHYGERPSWISQPIADIIDRMEDIIKDARDAKHAGDCEELAKRVMARLSDILKDAETTEDEHKGLPIEKTQPKSQPKKQDAREGDKKQKPQKAQKQSDHEQEGKPKSEQKSDKNKQGKAEKQSGDKPKESAKPSRDDNNDNDGGDEGGDGAALDGDDEESEDSDNGEGKGAAGDEETDGDESEEGGGEEGGEGEDFDDQDFESDGEGSGGDSGDGETEGSSGDGGGDDDLGDGDTDQAGSSGSQDGASGITQPPDIDGKQPFSSEMKDEAGRLLSQDAKDKDMMDQVREVISKASKQQMMTDRQRHYTHPQVKDRINIVKPKP